MSKAKNTTLTFIAGLTFAVIMAEKAKADDLNAPEKLNAIYKCMTIQAETERLACYDQTVADFQSAKDSGQIIAISKTELEQATKEGFGFNIPSLSSLGKIFKSDKVKTKDTESTESKQVELTIERTKRIGSSKTRFYFTNGQIWDQVVSEKIYVPKAKNGIANTAIIKKAAFGSYLLRVNGKSRGIRVKRVD